MADLRGASHKAGAPRPRTCAADRRCTPVRRRREAYEADRPRSRRVAPGGCRSRRLRVTVTSRPEVPPGGYCGHRRARRLVERLRPGTYYRIEHTLASIAATRSRLGLVAVLATSPTRLYRRGRRRGAQADAPVLRPAGRHGYRSRLREQPSCRERRGDQWFSAGTRISSGLFLAAHMLQEQQVEARRRDPDQRPRRRSS